MCRAHTNFKVVVASGEEGGALGGFTCKCMWQNVKISRSPVGLSAW